MIRLVDLIMKKYKDMGHTSPGDALRFSNLDTIEVGKQSILPADLQDGIDEAIELGWLEQRKNSDLYILTDEGAAQL